MLYWLDIHYDLYEAPLLDGRNRPKADVDEKYEFHLKHFYMESKPSQGLR